MLDGMCVCVCVMVFKWFIQLKRLAFILWLAFCVEQIPVEVSDPSLLLSTDGSDSSDYIQMKYQEGQFRKQCLD